VPYLTWFSRKEPVVEAKEPPTNMLAAMGITAFLCVFIGVYPQALYRLLPYTVEYAPYAPAHVIGMSQLLLFTFVGFWALRSKLHGTPTITLDTDWFYRKAGKRFIWFCEKPLLKFATDIDKVMKDLANSFIRFSRNPMAASMILITATSTRLLTPFNPAYRQKGQELVEARKQAVEEPMEKMSIGMGVLLVLLFFAFYLLIYLTHGVLWA
jgi:formate hydrogenlyase subunit 3/multisubunit Na+/H+ antiporter MnhD subunit